MKLIVAAVLIAAATAVPQEEITIGLVVPSVSDGAGRQAVCGSEAAVKRARQWGGTPGRSIRLVIAASRNPWDDVAPQVARLIHEEGARVVLGGLDAAGAHAGQQVILRERGRAAFVSLWASESALTQLPVPWYFSIVPEDRVQARALVNEIFDRRRAARAAVYADGSREGRSLASAFEQASPPGAVLRFASEDARAASRIAALVREGAVQAVVLMAPPEASARLVRELGGRSCEAPLFGSLRLATPLFGQPADPVDGDVLVPWPIAAASAAADVRAACGHQASAGPTPLAIYAYEAATTALASLEAAASQPVSIPAKDMPGLMPVAVGPP